MNQEESPSIEIQFRGRSLRVKVMPYNASGTCLFLEEADGTPGLKATVWVAITPTLALDYMFVKDWSENTGILKELVRFDVVRDTGKEFRVGHVAAKLCQLTIRAAGIFNIPHSEPVEHRQGPQREPGEPGYLPPGFDAIKPKQEILDTENDGLSKAFAEGADAAPDGADGSFEEGGEGAELDAGPSDLIADANPNTVTDEDINVLSSIQQEHVEEVAREVQEGMDETAEQAGLVGGGETNPEPNETAEVKPIIPPDVA